MDEDGNIYTLDFEKIGKAGESDEDEELSNESEASEAQRLFLT